MGSFCLEKFLRKMTNLMKIIRYLVLILILFNFNKLNAEDRSNQLNKLFDESKNDNVALVYGIEQKIWKMWSTHPTNQFLTSKLAEGSRLVRNKQLSKAVKIFTEVIEEDPAWAEAWNKRDQEIYPAMQSPKTMIKQIKKLIKQQLI
tara:strand:+ start:275 stop:715 length:441 start_codon:yes stop_codon:yes gene_type:complete